MLSMAVVNVRELMLWSDKCAKDAQIFMESTARHAQSLLVFHVPVDFT